MRTGEQQASVDFASVEEVDLAVVSAKAACQLWSATPLSRRTEVMFNVRELIHVNRRAIAEKITLEHGKTLTDAMGEVARGGRRQKPHAGASGHRYRDGGRRRSFGGVLIGW